MKQKDWYYYLLMVCTTLLWGSSFVLTKQLLNYFSPISLIYLRVVIASVLFFIICLVFFRKDLKIERKDIKTLLAFSCFEPFLYFILETYGLKHSDPSVVSIIIATIPMFVAFLSIYYFKENFTKTNLLGVFISFIGILVMLLPSIHDEAFSLLGIACAFGAVLSAVGYSFFIRKFPSNYNPVVVITYQNIIGVILFTPLFFVINTPASIQMQLSHLYNIKTAMYVLILAIFCSSVAFIFYLKGIRYFGIGKANVFTNLIPVVTAVLSFFLVGESFPIYKVIGIFIVICGIFLVQKKSSKQ